MEQYKNAPISRVNPTAEQGPRRESGKVIAWPAGKFNWIHLLWLTHVMTEYLLNAEQPYWVPLQTDDLLRFRTWISSCLDIDSGAMWVKGGCKLPAFCLGSILHPCRDRREVFHKVASTTPQPTSGSFSPSAAPHKAFALSLHLTALSSSEQAVQFAWTSE